MEAPKKEFEKISTKKPAARIRGKLEYLYGPSKKLKRQTKIRTRLRDTPDTLKRLKKLF